MDNLPLEIQKMLEKGYQNISNDTNKNMQISETFEKKRILDRMWRNLLAEAKYDLPQCLHEYVLDWSMPSNWETLPNIQRITLHDFIIQLPGFVAINVVYKKIMGDWAFFRFEIIFNGQNINSNRYCDLPLFLAIARQLIKPRKRSIVIEEIGGKLADNAKTVKVKGKIRILTTEDFLVNPDYDMGQYSDLPIFL